jgi:hypothetical protein
MQEVCYVIAALGGIVELDVPWVVLVGYCSCLLGGVRLLCCVSLSWWLDESRAIGPLEVRCS